MLVINPADGAIVDANPAACRFYGWTREQLQGKRINQINALRAGTGASGDGPRPSPQTFHFQFPHRRADGSVREVEVFSGPISMGDRQLLYSIVHDITERRIAEAKVQDQVAELRRWHEATLGREKRVLE